MAVCAVLLWVAIKHCPSSASSVTGFWGGASAGVGARQLPGSASRFRSAATSQSLDWLKCKWQFWIYQSENCLLLYHDKHIKRYQHFVGKFNSCLLPACLSSANDSALILTCRSEVWVIYCENNLLAKHKSKIQGWLQLQLILTNPQFNGHRDPFRSVSLKLSVACCKVAAWCFFKQAV